MKDYKAPELTVEVFELEDVLTVSLQSGEIPGKEQEGWY